MSLKFNPDDSLLNSSWAVVLLSERDVAGQIPINFVTTSAISLSAACFANNTFERTAAGKCLSNLLAVGFYRFNIDIYWSSDLQSWLLCPASIPQNVDVVKVSSNATTTSTTTAGVTQGTTLAETDASSGQLLYDLGSYKCSDNLDVSDVVDVFLDYFRETSSQSTIYTRYISLNLHVATSSADINQTAAQVAEDQLPTGSNRISSLFQSKLSSYIYTPSRLLSERQNLNESWYEVDDTYKPVVEYFTIKKDASGTQSTPDGWPSTKYIQLAAERRLLVEYGTIDSQLSGYNLSEDNSVIFPLGYLTSTVPVSVANDGALDSGCLYASGATDISKVNSSWATSDHIPIPTNLSQDEELGYLSNLVMNLAACGITSTLNNSLFGDTADTSPEPYRTLSLSSSWAWASGQPQSPYSNSDNDTVERCAVMDLSQEGHWHTANCTEVRRAACRVENQPYGWALSSTAYSYTDAYANGCAENADFSVPRTGLENTYLFRYLLSLPADVLDPSSSDPLKREIWLDFNSIDVATCWVSGGPEANCPYSADPQQLEKRTVLVAAIAGIVILIIFALTLFVKCNANRRNSRRNKRVIQGWEYEGVPS